MSSTTKSRRPTITLGICLAAGLAAGIGLARPGASAAPPAAPPQAAATAAPAAGGYGGADATPAPQAATPAPATAEPTVTIAGFDFGAPIVAAGGGTVTVVNADGVAHTLTADDGSFDTGSIGGGATSTVTAPSAPGTYEFFCTIHPSMRGSLTVAG
jgi:plastocyanin